jgi:hypothetical protein
MFGGNGVGIWAKSVWNDTVFGSFGDSTAYVPTRSM